MVFGNESVYYTNSLRELWSLTSQLLIVKGIFHVSSNFPFFFFKELLAHHHQLELESHGQVNVSTGIIFFQLYKLTKWHAFMSMTEADKLGLTDDRLDIEACRGARFPSTKWRFLLTFGSFSRSSIFDNFDNFITYFSILWADLANICLLCTLAQLLKSMCTKAILSM